MSASLHFEFPSHVRCSKRDYMLLRWCIHMHIFGLILQIDDHHCSYDVVIVVRWSAQRWASFKWVFSRWTNVYLPPRGDRGVELIHNYQQRCRWFSVDVAINIWREIISQGQNGRQNRQTNVRWRVRTTMQIVRTIIWYARYCLRLNYVGSIETCPFLEMLITITNSRRIFSSAGNAERSSYPCCKSWDNNSKGVREE